MLAFCLVASILTCMGRSFRAASSGFVYHVLNRGNARRKLFFKMPWPAGEFQGWFRRDPLSWGPWPDVAKGGSYSIEDRF